jgi:hypothetical protein
VFGCPREYRAGSAENMRRGEVKRADEGLVFKETKEGEGWWEGGEMVKKLVGDIIGSSIEQAM